MTASSPFQASPRARALFGLLIITLLFAPLFRAGLAPLPLLALELLAVSLLGLALWNPGKISVNAKEIITLGLILLLPLLYLVYLPAGVLDGVPGQGAYRANLGLVSGESLDGALTLVASRPKRVGWCS